MIKLKSQRSQDSKGVASSRQEIGSDSDSHYQAMIRSGSKIEGRATIDNVMFKKPSKSSRRENLVSQSYQMPLG